MSNKTVKYRLGNHRGKARLWLDSHLEKFGWTFGREYVVRYSDGKIVFDARKSKFRAADKPRRISEKPGRPVIDASARAVANSLGGIGTFTKSTITATPLKS